VRRGTISLTDLQHHEIVLFSSYTLAGLVLPPSSFLTLLENYGHQLHHLMLHAIGGLVPPILHTAILWEEYDPPRGLLLPG
jgi:hypothetical protein